MTAAKDRAGEAGAAEVGAAVGWPFAPVPGPAPDGLLAEGLLAALPLLPLMPAPASESVITSVKRRPFAQNISSEISNKFEVQVSPLARTFKF